MFGKSVVSEYDRDPELIVGIDIGTSKIAVVVAEKEPGFNEPQIIVVDAVPSEGVRKGIIVNADLVSKTINKVINIAENMVGQSLKKAIVAFSCGDDISCVKTSGKRLLGVNARPVLDEDIVRVIQLAKEDLAVPSNKKIIHTIPVSYHLDDEDIENPVSMTGKNLLVDLETIMIPAHIINNVCACVQRAGVEVEDLIIKPLASGLSVISREEAEAGAVVLDIGGGTTSVTVYSNGHPVYAGLIPIGGDHITNDLAQVLKIPLINAEELKQAVVLCDDKIAETEEENIQFICNGHTYTIPYDEVTDIITCRLKELCEDFIIPKISESAVSSLSGGVILTGGVSKTAGIDVLMRTMFNLPVRIAMPTAASAMPRERNSQEYSGVAGIIKYVTEKQNNRYKYIDESTVLISEMNHGDGMPGTKKNNYTRVNTEKAAKNNKKHNNLHFGDKVIRFIKDICKDLF